MLQATLSVITYTYALFRNKSIILNTINVFGGNNTFLGICFVVVGGISLLLGIGFIIMGSNPLVIIHFKQVF